MTDEQAKLPPGSSKALDAGCLCPRIDNRYGRGVYTNTALGIQYWINEDCPIHGKQSDDEQETE